MKWLFSWRIQGLIVIRLFLNIHNILITLNAPITKSPITNPIPNPT